MKAVKHDILPHLLAKTLFTSHLYEQRVRKMWSVIGSHIWYCDYSCCMLANRTIHCLPNESVRGGWLQFIGYLFCTKCLVHFLGVGVWAEDGRLCNSQSDNKSTQSM